MPKFIYRPYIQLLTAVCGIGLPGGVATAASVRTGFEFEWIAAEPTIRNPVAISVDDDGHFMVAESYRLERAVPDVRSVPKWADRDGEFRFVKDRLSFLNDLSSEPESANSKAKSLFLDRDQDGRWTVRDWRLVEDRVRFLRDSDGDGKPDRIRTSVSGFNRLGEGPLGAVHSIGGVKYAGSPPYLWVFDDRDGDGKWEGQRPLFSSFGPRVGFAGHGITDIVEGPDGRVYWCVGDRGTDPDFISNAPVDLSTTGAVFRSWPNGANPELYAYGLRDPAGLAFDAMGNLWALDRSSGKGDNARLLYLMKGGDYGWRRGMQWTDDSVWVAENYWAGSSAAPRPASCLPAVAHLAGRPSGLVHSPGGALGGVFPDFFFSSDESGGVRFFQCAPDGASFRLVSRAEDLLSDPDQTMAGALAWGFNAVDLEFGFDGHLYVAGNHPAGGEGASKDGVFMIRPARPAAGLPHPDLLEELRRDLSAESVRRLDDLLGHGDWRVRLKAQKELASRGGDAIRALNRVARRAERSAARRHAVWALARIGWTETKALGELVDLLESEFREVRLLAARALGDFQFPPAYSRLLNLALDDSPAVRLEAVLAVARYGKPDCVQTVFNVLRQNRGRDPFLRQACVTAIQRSGNMNALLDAAMESDPEIRLAAALSLGGLRRRETAYYLNDDDPRIVLAAARAIHDGPIPDAMSSLASLADAAPEGISFPMDYAVPIYRRVINAAFRLGQTEHAAGLSAFAANKRLPEALRAEALDALSYWETPPARDRVTGAWNPLAPREARSARIPLSLEIQSLLESESLTLRTAAVRAAGLLKMQSSASRVLECFQNERLPKSLRLSALNALGRMEDFNLAAAIQQALRDSDPEIVRAGVEWMGRLPSERAIGLLSDVLDHGSVEEKRKAFVRLSDIPGAAVDGIFLKWLIYLNRGEVPAELHDDLLSAARKRNNDSLNRRIERHLERGEP